MFNWIKNSKWFRDDRTALDVLFTHCPVSVSPIEERLDWWVRLLQWIRIPSKLDATPGEFKSGKTQATRARYLLQVLDRNPQWKLSVARLLRSLIQDTQAVDLFTDLGIPSSEGLIEEFLARLGQKIIPSAPDDRSLMSVFSETFKIEDDALWVEQLEPAVVRGWVELFSYSPKGTFDRPDWNTLPRDLVSSLRALATSVRALALAPGIRHRLDQGRWESSALVLVESKVQLFLEQASDKAAFSGLSLALDNAAQLIILLHVMATPHARQEGISVRWIFLLDCLDAQLRRIRALAATYHEQLIAPAVGYQASQDLLVELVRDQLRSRSLRALFSDNLGLLAQKIADTTAEVGEHYIARSGKDAFLIFKSALGGGAVTALTTLFKFLLHVFEISPMVTGLLATVNYSVSFMAMQVLHLTLATKQPAMTASFFAAEVKKIGVSSGPDALKDFILEIGYWFKTQVLAVFGNVVAVIPVVAIIALGIRGGTGKPMLQTAQAEYIMDSFSILGPTPFYAAFTGILLWISSLVSGWADNTFQVNRMNVWIARSRFLQRISSREFAQKLSDFFDRNIAGFAGSISLAFFLGMTTPLAQFVGLPLEPRHITLSAGSLTAAAMVLGKGVFSQPAFWKAVLGVLSMGVLNIGVAFVLALRVALRAQKVDQVVREKIREALVLRVVMFFRLFLPKWVTKFF